MKKLVCDRCGLELTDPEDIGMAFDGRDAWKAAVKARGVQPRGIIPCKHYIRCGGEVRIVAGDGIFRWRRWTVRLFSR